ncbi:citrate/2-methylcitrate synthase [Streptomyces sp. NPDC007088]|uniref:citrate/2-methylcitrate synthase n=1 Tax=Streptomyces sp. NPDC007088 TaxID=3364773 RepID=UPI00368B4F0B
MISDVPAEPQPTRTDGRLSAPDGRLTTRETAARLGVKPATVYAYVSRGQLDRRRGPDGRGSTFDPAEVDALAARSRREAAAPPEGPLGRLRTGITLLTQEACYYRGVDSRALAGRYGYEEVADWLWTGELRPDLRFSAPRPLLAQARRSVAALSAHAGPTDRLRAAVVATGAADPLRFRLAPSDVTATARDLLAVLVDVLPLHGGAGAGARSERGGDTEEMGADVRPAPGADSETGSSPAPLAERLWTRLTDREPDPAGVRALDTALVLLLDHDLAASTLAARVAASSRAHPYAVVSAGLGALDSPLHGAASGLAHRMLSEVLDRGDATPVVAAHLRAGHPVPGLGHRLYEGGDPRAQALFAALAPLPYARAALEAARAVSRTAASAANVDLALAVLSVAAGMPADAGETVFAVARTGGWIAHALEEYAETPLRLRPRGTYTGPEAGRPVPEAR